MAPHTEPAQVAKDFETSAFRLHGPEVQELKIYSKTGDDGTTGLVGGVRIRKEDPRIEAIGTLDELNAVIGVATSHALPAQIAAILIEVQSRLFDIGGELATPLDSKFNNESLSERDVLVLESSIDHLTAELAPLANFILPGGTAEAAYLHHARTVCRRGERAVLRLVPSCRSVVIHYLNRLSDWLFVAARTCNARSDVEDIKWIPRKEK